MKNLSIQPPLKGEWKVLSPPGHHPDALDFVQVDKERKSSHQSNRLKFFISRIPSNSFFCWNKPIFSPIDGEVIRIGNGWKDNEYCNLLKTIQLWYNGTFKFRPEEVDGRLDIRPNAGNHVMIQSKEGYIVFLAHLRNQSVLVAEGEQVSKGQPIAKLGNSGNSGMPHLHINLFDQMENPLTAKVLPFVFSDYQVLNNGLWSDSKLSIPRAGAFVKFNS